MWFCLARNYPARHDEFVHNHGRYEIGVVAQVFESAEAATRECDLFIVDYVRTKRQPIKMEKQLELMQLKLDSLKTTEPKIVRLFDDE